MTELLNEQTTDPTSEYRGPEADAKAARIQATLGTDAETLVDTVWLLRYTTVKHNIQWPTHDELMEMRRD
jgi:hypothetical protein